MLVICIILSLCVGFILGHFLWTKVKVEQVVKEIPIEKIIKEKVEAKPFDYDDYLAWKKHKDEWINLKNMIPDVTIQDDIKFDKIMNAINEVLNQTESGEFTPPKARKRNRNK